MSSGVSPAAALRSTSDSSSTGCGMSTSTSHRPIFACDRPSLASRADVPLLRAEIRYVSTVICGHAPAVDPARPHPTASEPATTPTNDADEHQALNPTSGRQPTPINGADKHQALDRNEHHRRRPTTPASTGPRPERAPARRRPTTPTSTGSRSERAPARRRPTTPTSISTSDAEPDVSRSQ